MPQSESPITSLTAMNIFFTNKNLGLKSHCLYKWDAFDLNRDDQKT